MSITQPVCVCVFLALGMQLAMRVRRFAICGLTRSTIFFPHYLINGTTFVKKFTEQKMCVLVSSVTFV